MVGVMAPVEEPRTQTAAKNLHRPDTLLPEADVWGTGVLR